MQRFQAFKYELRPDVQQEQQMRRFAGACRVVFNEALALQTKRYEAGEKKLGYVALAKYLTEWRNGAPLPSGRIAPWLAESPVHSLQQSLKDLESAYTNFFAKRANFPRRKKKGRSDSFRYTDPARIKLDQDNSRIWLPKLGWVHYRNSRVVLGEIRFVTVKFSAGKWYVSILTKCEVEQPVPKGQAVGIDMGIVHLATLSDRTFVPPLNIYKRYAAELRKAQQAMSRKKKFSNNWRKAKARIQRIHVRIANARRDYLHKASTTISKNHAMVVVEDLQVSNMSRSAAGTVEQPGRNVRAKAGLNRSILDQGWAEFRRQLEYKMFWVGGVFLAVSPQNTSRTCPQCGYVSGENRQTQADFACVECGYSENADLVGAINILRAGHARLACEVSGEAMPPAAGTHRSDSEAAQRCACAP
jgi:putative transposase